MACLSTFERCSGCMACIAGCPHNAITICSDNLGNFFPSIDEKRCVDCGKCSKICPELNPTDSRNSKRAYAVWSLEPDCRKSSASGGAAAEFYKKALEDGFWICGAEYTADGHVIHTLSKEQGAIKRYKQSKYVYSETNHIYQKIKEKLDNGENVLIISLPCKIAGLIGYLGKQYENLLTVDIVCHGTPSGQLLRDHIAKVAPGIEDFSLRFREDNEFKFSLQTGGKVVYCKIGRTDPYLAAFLEGLSYRQACYTCRWAEPKRISDLTICDFWGLGAEIPFDHPYTGAISAVLVNTEKGGCFFEICRERLFVEERPVGEVVNGNAQLNAPTSEHPQRAVFEALYKEFDFDVAVNEVLCEEIRAARKELRRVMLRRKIRRLAGVFLKRYRG